mgnify:FL=1
MTCTDNLLNLRRQDVHDWQGTHVMSFIFLIEDTTFSVVWSHGPFWHFGHVNKYLLLSCSFFLVCTLYITGAQQDVN